MLKDIITQDLNNALKNKDALTLKVLRVIKSELQAVEKRNPQTYTQELEYKVVDKLCNQYKDTISAGEKCARQDIVNDAKAELDIANKYVRKKSDVNDIIACARIICSMRKTNQGQLSMKDMKPILATVKETYPDAEGGVIASVLKEFL